MGTDEFRTIGFNEQNTGICMYISKITTSFSCKTAGFRHLSCAARLKLKQWHNRYSQNHLSCKTHTLHTELHWPGKTLKVPSFGRRNWSSIREDVYLCSECRGETGSINTVDVQRGEWNRNSFCSINTTLYKPQQPTWYSPRFSITEFEAQQSTVPERQRFEH